MAQPRLPLFAAGHTDDVMGAPLTHQGYRSPQRPQGLPSTVRTIRRTHGLRPQRHQSHPRHVAGYLSGPQRARRLGVSPPWRDDRLAHGRMQREKAPTTGLDLGPDQPATVQPLPQLQAGTRTPVGWRPPTADIHTQTEGGTCGDERRKYHRKHLEEA